MVIDTDVQNPHTDVGAHATKRRKAAPKRVGAKSILVIASIAATQDVKTRPKLNVSIVQRSGRTSRASMVTALAAMASHVGAPVKKVRRAAHRRVGAESILASASQVATGDVKTPSTKNAMSHNVQEMERSG